MKIYKIFNDDKLECIIGIQKDGNVVVFHDCKIEKVYVADFEKLLAEMKIAGFTIKSSSE